MKAALIEQGSQYYGKNGQIKEVVAVWTDKQGVKQLRYRQIDHGWSNRLQNVPDLDQEKICTFECFRQWAHREVPEICPALGQNRAQETWKGDNR